MKKYSLIVLIYTLFALFSCENNSNDSKITLFTPKIEYLADSSLMYIELCGSPYERGFQHGSLLKKEIQEVIKLLKNDIFLTTEIEADNFIEDFFNETDFIPSIKKWSPDLWDEVKGISDGSEIDFETILFHQLGDEFFFYTEYIFAHKCSSMGVNKSSSQSSITAQNMDIPPYFDGYQTVIKYKDSLSNKEIMYLTIPGHIGITGMNNQFVSINCNILMQLKNQTTGLPVSFIVRSVLNQNSQNEAIAFLKTIEHASGQNYIIGGKEKVYSFECSSSKIEEFKPFESAEFTYHTNHPLINLDFSDRYLEMLEENDLTIEEAKNICKRFPSFEKRFNEDTESISIDDIKEVLSSKDHDGIDVMSNVFTYASVIYVLDDQPTFIISPGKPHNKEYLEIKF